MSDTTLPPDLRAFLIAQLGSFEKLEIARDLASTDPAGTVAALCARLQLDRTMAEAAIAELVRDGWLDKAPDGSVRMSRKAREDARFRAILESYDEDRTPILGALSSHAMSKIRSLAARTFADAFVLRRKRDDDDG